MVVLENLIKCGRQKEIFFTTNLVLSHFFEYFFIYASFCFGVYPLVCAMIPVTQKKSSLPSDGLHCKKWLHFNSYVIGDSTIFNRVHFIILQNNPPIFLGNRLWIWHLPATCNNNFSVLSTSYSTYLRGFISSITLGHAYQTFNWTLKNFL